ncbi:MAG TPA: serine/threonine-protein kinase, partial [Chthoniobacterales bacterium]
MDELDLGQTIRGFAAGQKILNRYTFVRILGRGGMGVVWLARDDELEREVALKFLPELVVHDRGVLDELKRETRRSLALTHHNIVRIYDFAQDGECACISMEYVDGTTLSSLRVDQPDKVFEVESLAPLVGQVCDALQYAHVQARIVHRDLKPSNLMVNAKGDVKVADFGIARSLTDSVSMLTMARGTSGTLAYMSPQQLDGERVSELDDIYALGATLYELLTGKPPFYSGQIDRLVREKLPPPIAVRREDLAVTSKTPVPQHWEDAVMACLAKDPAFRPQSALELKERLLFPERATVRPVPPVAPPPPAPPPLMPSPIPPTPAAEENWIRQHPIVLISGAAAIALLTAGIVWLLMRPAPREESAAVAPQPMPAASIVPFPTSTIPSPAPSTPAPTMAAMPSVAPIAPAVTPVPSASAATSSTRIEIERLIETHLRAVANNDAVTAASLYGDQVDFLSEGIKSHDTLAREIAEYFARWPSQNFRITSDVTIDAVTSNEKTVSFTMDFAARSNVGKTSEGTVAVTWIVRRPGPGSQFKIVSQKQRTIARTTSSPPASSYTTDATTSEKIRQFVANHFAKTERLDCDGVLSDYASRVDYFDHGVVGKDY